MLLQEHFINQAQTPPFRVGGVFTQQHYSKLSLYESDRKALKELKFYLNLDTISVVTKNKSSAIMYV